MHAVGLRGRHPHRTIAAPQFAFGSDVGRATNCHPHRLQLVEDLEPIAEYFVIGDDVVDDHVQPGAGGCRNRVVICVHSRRHDAPIFNSQPVDDVTNLRRSRESRRHGSTRLRILMIGCSDRE
jgi:hypothetical protein